MVKSIQKIKFSQNCDYTDRRFILSYRFKSKVLLLLLCFTSLSAGASELFLVCTRKSETRWIRTFQSQDGKCKTIYSKEGFAQVISSSVSYSSCEAVLLNVKKNIEDGGFKCKEQNLGGALEL